MSKKVRVKMEVEIEIDENDLMFTHEETGKEISLGKLGGVEVYNDPKFCEIWDDYMICEFKILGINDPSNLPFGKWVSSGIQIT